MTRTGCVVLGSLAIGLVMSLGAGADPRGSRSCENLLPLVPRGCGSLGAASSGDAKGGFVVLGPTSQQIGQRAFAERSEHPRGDKADRGGHGSASASGASAAMAAALAGAPDTPRALAPSDASLPISRAERDAFRLAAQGCWKFDSASPAGRSSVMVGFDLDQTGRVAGPVELLWHDAPTSEAAAEAFQAAKQAILGCQDSAVPLPTAEHDHGRHAELTFDARTWAIR